MRKLTHNTSTNHGNGDDANRLLLDAVGFNSPENQNRDNAIIGYGPVLKCKCEMPAKMHGKNLYVGGVSGHYLNGCLKSSVLVRGVLWQEDDPGAVYQRIIK